MQPTCREIAAYHEAGHAVVGYHGLVDGRRIVKIVVPAAGHGGTTQWGPEYVWASLPSSSAVEPVVPELLVQIAALQSAGRPISWPRSSLPTCSNPSLTLGMAQRLEHLALLVAGALAAEMVFGDSIDSGGHDDENKISMYMDALCPFHSELRRPIRCAATIIAQLCLKAHRPALEALASELKQREEIGGVEAHAIISGAHRRVPTGVLGPPMRE